MKINLSILRTVAAYSLFIQINCAIAIAQSQPHAKEVKQTPPNQVSIFPDRNLEKAVRQAIYAKRNNNDPITVEDVKKLSSIRGWYQGIKDLSGLEHCQALMSLELAGNEIKDLTPIANLSRLQLLDLSNNQIEDISPLAEMKNLQHLNIEKNQVSDISVLSDLKQLNSFYGDNNQISDIQPAFKLEKLWSLNVSNNRIVSLEGISQMKKVDSFNLSGNQIADLSPLVNRYSEGKKEAQFVRVYLDGNPLDSPKAKAQIEALKKLGVMIQSTIAVSAI